MQGERDSILLFKTLVVGEHRQRSGNGEHRLTILDYRQPGRPSVDEAAKTILQDDVRRLGFGSVLRPRARSSAAERSAHNRLVVGSNPAEPIYC